MENHNKIWKYWKIREKFVKNSQKIEQNHVESQTVYEQKKFGKNVEITKQKHD